MDKIVYKRFDLDNALKNNNGKIDGIKIQDLDIEIVELTGTIRHEGEKSLIFYSKDGMIRRINKGDILSIEKIEGK